jgi:hypothetical protein
MTKKNFDLLAIVAIFLAYSVTIRLAIGGLDVIQCLLDAAANTVPVVIFAIAVRRIVVRRLIGEPLATQLTAHLLLCVVFAIFAYVLLIVLLGLVNSGGPEGFVLRPFSGGGAAWQSLENVTTYALIAAIAHLQVLTDPSAAARRGFAIPGTSAVPAERGPTRPPSSIASRERTAPGTRPDASLSRYFVRIGEELRPLDINAIVSIAGADDYTEVRTLSSKHLVRVTLAEFAKSLDPAKYIRVHRSWIVNTDRVARAEPAGGGRLLLHMETGETISTSREGAKLLRNRVL